MVMSAHDPKCCVSALSNVVLPLPVPPDTRMVARLQRAQEVDHGLTYGIECYETLGV
jgi:hypothetical protein